MGRAPKGEEKKFVGLVYRDKLLVLSQAEVHPQTEQE